MQGDHPITRDDILEPAQEHLLLMAKRGALHNGDVAVVMLEGDEAVVKRVYRTEDHLLLVSENRDYRPQQAPLDTTIIGKVVMSLTHH